MKLFVDTSAFIALEDKSDNYHLPALEFKKEIANNKYRLITSNFILAETYTLLRHKVSHQKAVGFGNIIHAQ
jgi:hypothetical protein